MGKLITATNAADLLGMTAPTFYKLVETEEDDLLTPADSTGHKMWYLDDILKYLSKRDDAEHARRRALLEEWNAIQTTEG